MTGQHRVLLGPKEGRTVQIWGWGEVGSETLYKKCLLSWAKGFVTLLEGAGKWGNSNV